VVRHILPVVHVLPVSLVRLWPLSLGSSSHLFWIFATSLPTYSDHFDQRCPSEYGLLLWFLKL